MDWWIALIFGVVEGITEFLPVSSTGHLILTAKCLGLAQNDFIKSFEIVIQLGAILSVIVLYGRTFLREWEVVKKVMAAFLPTAVVGFLLYKIIKKYLLGYEVVLWSLLIGGIVLIVFEIFHREKEDAADSLNKITYRQAIVIGLFQSLAVIPGVSRAAATIVGGLLFGLNRRTIVEFSFLLAVPTMMAATGLDFFKNYKNFHVDQLHFLAIGFVTSFAVALFTIKFLLQFIQRNNFIPFGIYRIVLAILFLIFIK